MVPARFPRYLGLAVAFCLESTYQASGLCRAHQGTQWWPASPMLFTTRDLVVGIG